MICPQNKCRDREYEDNEKKMNQRLFKRLILYYNVGGAQKSPPAIYSQKQTALHQLSGDSRRAVDPAARAPSCRGRGSSAAFPFGVAEAGTGSLTTLTDVDRDLYLVKFDPILTFLQECVNRANQKETEKWSKP
ncbi:MAG: hypothetical protein HFF50_02385 [Lawsonibacter sp.]|nr:hypothetical protein [Lawsonibacter sp.]